MSSGPGIHGYHAHLSNIKEKYSGDQMPSLLVKIKNRLNSIFGQGKINWKNIEYFDECWKKRIELMAAYIKEGESVVDLGCGKMWLKEFLPKNNPYYAVDYKKRDSNTILCDFNKEEYPGIIADVYFVSGCLEYVKNYSAFLDNIARHARRCIISYCCIEFFPDVSRRRKKGWANDLSRHDVLGEFSKVGMMLKAENRTQTNNSIFVFEKKPIEK